jgi:hypothetical protein
MIRSYGKLFPVQPSYVPKDQVSKDKFLWEFTDFFDNHGEIKVLDPEYTFNTSEWDPSEKKDLARMLGIVNTFKPSNQQTNKKNFNFHPEYYNRGKKGYDFYTIAKEIFGLEAYRSWLAINGLKHIYLTGNSEDEDLNLRKIKYYTEEQMKINDEKTKEDL